MNDETLPAYDDLRAHLDGLLGGAGAGLAGDAAPALVRTARRRQHRARAAGVVAAVAVAAVAVAGGGQALRAGGPRQDVPGKIGPAPGPPPAIGYVDLKTGPVVTLPAGFTIAETRIAGGMAWALRPNGAGQELVGTRLSDGASSVLAKDVPADTSPLVAAASYLAYVQRVPGGPGLELIRVAVTTGRVLQTSVIPGAAGDPAAARVLLSPLDVLVDVAGTLTLLNDHSGGVSHQVSAPGATLVGPTGTNQYLLLRGGRLQVLHADGTLGSTGGQASGDPAPQVVNDTVTVLAGGLLTLLDEDILEVDATAKVAVGTSRGLVNGSTNAAKGVVVTAAPPTAGVVLVQRRDQHTLVPVGAPLRITVEADATDVSLVESHDATLVLEWTSAGRIQARTIGGV